jgi:hypothetical protein
LVIISEIVEALKGRNACRTSTVEDKLALIMRIIASFAVAPSRLVCSKPLNPKPKGKNNSTFPIRSLKSLALLKLSAISLREKPFLKEKSKGKSVLNSTRRRLKMISLGVH